MFGYLAIDLMINSAVEGGGLALGRGAIRGGLHPDVMRGSVNRKSSPQSSLINPQNILPLIVLPNTYQR
jgi:hypothetical protein